MDKISAAPDPMVPPDTKIVECADAQRAILLDGHRSLILWFLSINAVMWLLDGFLHTTPWLQGVAILAFAAFGIIPRLLRANRNLSQTQCPACGRPVGGHFTENSRIHLRCRHCGEVSPTDCGVAGCGGVPYKITW